MTLRRTKPIADLYAEVADYDLVVVPDAPLASALNRRLERPHFGPFAITPRRLAARRRETAEDRLAFLAVIEETDLGWKEAAAAVGDVLQCWEHEGAVEAVLEYEGFDTPAIRTAVECVGSLETTSRKLTEYEIDTGEYPSVAVVGEGRLTALERSILPPPDAYDSVDRFRDEAFDLPPFRIFDSPAAVVETLVETITAETADDVAVVLDDGSEYSTLLESALEAADVPFYGGPGFADEPDHRGFLTFLRTVFAGSDTRVGDVRPLLARLDATVDVDHDEKRLFAVDDPAIEAVRDLCRSCRSGTVADALAAYERTIDRRLDRFREELDRLGVLETRLTESVVDSLSFYLRSYEVPIERQNAGVLLADATSAGYVDRPVVFCLGLDEGWTHSMPRRPWVDRDATFERNVRQFQSVIQSGVDRHYLVVDAAGGSPVSPTIYFDAVLDEPFERFGDRESIEHTRPFSSSTGRTGFEREPLGVQGAPDPIETISQSSLNAFVNSPRDYLFSRLLDGPDRDYFAEGNLFHDFAEFYATHPEAVDLAAPADGATATDGDGETPVKTVLDELVEAMVAETRPFHREVDLATRRTRYRAGLTAIAAFLDDSGPDPHDDALAFLTPASGWGSNFFAEYFDRPVDAPHAERWFEDESLGLKGKIDLVAGPDHLLDFKSGSKKRASTVTGRSALDPPGDPPNYQALLYLTYWRRQRPGERLQFTFFHFLECLDDVVTSGSAIDSGGSNVGPDGSDDDPSGSDDDPSDSNVDPGDSNVDSGVGLAPDVDLDACLTTIAYRPVAYDEFVTTGAVFDGLCEDASNACNKTFSKADHEAFLAVLADHPIPKTRDGTELAESAFGTALTERLIETVGDYKYVRKGCVQACRYLAGLRKRTYFADDLDAFERFVDERIDELNACRRGEERFPVEGLGGEPNYRYVDHRDLLLEGASDGTTRDRGDRSASTDGGTNRSAPTDGETDRSAPTDGGTDRPASTDGGSDRFEGKDGGADR